MLVNRRANRQEVSGNNLSHRPLRSGAGTIASELASPTNESNPEESELGSVNERLASGEKPDPDSIVQVLGNDSDPIESEADWDGELVASEDEKQPGSLYTPVELHPREQDIYQGADGNGGFKFAANLTHRNAKYQRIIDKDYPLKERYLAALMLTEACSDIRRGKVYYVPMKIELGINSPRISNEDRATATRIYHRVPKLVYEPCEWGDEDVQTWKDMNHGVRLALLNSRAGWVKRSDLVLPIDLVWEDEEKRTTRLNAYLERSHLEPQPHPAGATLAITPKAYLGWHNELSKNATDRGFVKSGWEDSAGAFLTADDKTLEGFKMDNAKEVVQKLRGMYFEGRPRSVIRFQEAIDGIIDFHKTLGKHIKATK
ncbi:MAG: hypothetical protein L6R42_000272 [Xanthoria sp. 1 TBL-2021]|nr:MAG: hypothetical protein L6R42_000272 [Xanthoria sp. 1 TBL-2021]